MVPFVTTLENAVDLCNRICDADEGLDFEAIPYMMYVASYISSMMHTVLVRNGINPHTGEPLNDA
jgi:hypothetical protein